MVNAVKQGCRQWNNKTVNIHWKTPQVGLQPRVRSCKVSKHFTVNIDITFTKKLVQIQI